MDNNNDILMDGVEERIESFLRGTMSAKEEAAFKQDIKDNPELRERAKTMASLIKGFYIQESKKETDVVTSALNKKPIALTTPKAKKIPPLLWWACSAAAVFVIVFSAYKVQRYNTLESIISPYYIEYDMADMTRGDVDSATIHHLYFIFQQIQEKRNVTDAIYELEPIYASLDSDYTYYPYANDIAWNLALAYVKDDQIDKAIPILEKLKEDNPDTLISIKSDELLHKIRNIR